MKGTNCFTIPLCKTHFSSPFKMPDLSYHVSAPSLEVVELQLEVQVVPTGGACLELVWEAGAVAAQSRKGSLIKVT